MLTLSQYSDLILISNSDSLAYPHCEMKITDWTNKSNESNTQMLRSITRGQYFKLAGYMLHQN
jgi:hypothetical protein